MSRPAVTVVMPFAGSSQERAAALSSLRALDRIDGDHLILADNTGLPALPVAGVEVVPADAERSPAHARNAGAERALTEWILFLDADCRAPASLLDAYFAFPIAADVGALAGEVVAAADPMTAAARYGATKNFLDQAAHLAHPYRPRAAAANLMVRRAAFEQVGGFYEGVLAAEDTDFSWRLQQAGWRLTARPGARVEHHYRTTVRELRRQWRSYAAGRAWLARRYEGFEPEPALRRALARAPHKVLRRPATGARSVTRRGTVPATSRSRTDQATHLALDALLGLEELRGFALSNRPRPARDAAPVQVVLVADRFPERGDPFGEFARTLENARVEAVARPDAVAVELARELEIRYREDDGIAARATALLQLVGRHPLRCARDRLVRRGGEPPLSALAPAAVRLEHEPQARVHALGSGPTRAVARRLASLSRRPFEERAG